MKNVMKYYLVLLCLWSTVAMSQGGGDVHEIISVAERPISPSYRITEKPTIIDTVIPIPKINYPLLMRNMETDINLNQIGASRIKIVDKLDKLYPAYIKLGLGNYTSPLAEFYYNSRRNRRTNLGVHLNHFSSWKDLPDLSPSAYDQTTGKLFGEFFTTNFKIESEIDYLNNGYHFYGITDTTDFFTDDSLSNRVQGIGAAVKLSNYSRKDSAKLLWTVKSDYMLFHEFMPYWGSVDKNARNQNFMIGADFKYKLNKNVYALDFDWRYNRYKYAELDGTMSWNDRFNERNANVHLRPTISTYGDKWKVVYGLDLTFDFPYNVLNNVFNVVPVIEAKYSLFNDIFIPYVGIDGGVTQNTFYTLNRANPYILSGTDLLNEKLFNVYGGIKGTISKTISFNATAYVKSYKNKALFVNDTIFSDLNRFNVIYDDLSVFGVSGSMSYQKNEKLKIDAIAEYNKYTTSNEAYAWHLPEFKMTLRGSYNLFEKIYAKADFTLETGRKSPENMFNTTDPTTTAVDLGVIADANLHLEYRYNSRVSAFIQFNNIAGQKYSRWYKYRVQGFQVLGGITVGF
jgi:hypothetical protein